MKVYKLFMMACLAAAAISCTTKSDSLCGIVKGISAKQEITLVTADGKEYTIDASKSMLISNPEGVLPGMPVAVDFDQKGFEKTATRIEAPIRSRVSVGTIANSVPGSFDIIQADGSAVHYTAPEGFALPQCDENTIVVVFYLEEGVAAYAKIRE